MSILFFISYIQNLDQRHKNKFILFLNIRVDNKKLRLIGFSRLRLCALNLTSLSFVLSLSFLPPVLSKNYC